MTSFGTRSEAQLLKPMKLLEGEKAPYYGILMQESRYRQLRSYEEFYQESPKVAEEVLELRIKNNSLEKECECTPIKDAVIWTLVGFLLGASVKTLMQ